MKKKSVERKKTLIGLIAVLLAGLSLMLYPFVADYWNSMHQSQAIATYLEAVNKIDDDRYDQMLADAKAYNNSLLIGQERFNQSQTEHEYYDSLLDITENGLMGYIEIPSIDVSLPIYHGTEDDVLQRAIGHIEGSSLPTGGPGTHCALSGHRGLPSSRLFTDLDQLSEGDIFTLMIMDETLTYEVDQIRIVDPDDLEELEIIPGQDLCTLVTCTPYGVNSHRLLVRGHRIEGSSSSILRVTADALMIDPRLVAPAIAIPILLSILAIMIIKNRKNKH